MEQKTESHHEAAHKAALEYASKHYDPIIEREMFEWSYWQVMAGRGWRPYYLGMSMS